MDKEIFFINNILNENTDGLTTSDISKILFEQYDIKVSRQIVKNYLWSYFRGIIIYDSSTYTYKLDENIFFNDDIKIKAVSKSPRSLNTNIEGGKIILEYRSSLSFEKLLKALGIINFNTSKKNISVDLIKRLNRIIEELDD